MPSRKTNRASFPSRAAAVVQRFLFPPGPILERLTRNRWTVDGEVIDRKAQWLLMVSKATGASMPDMGPKVARRYYARLCVLLEAKPPAVEEARDIELDTRSGQRPGRLYRPVGTSTSDVLPGLVYFHGGGHTIGSIDTHDVFCRRLCAEAGCAVVSVDYRLAPEEPFPAALHDCYDSTVEVSRRAEDFGIDRARIIVGGDSAGGNLAAVVSAVARDDDGPPIKGQLLIYPGTNGPNHPGRKNPGLQEGFGLDAKTTKWFAANYIGDDDERNPGISPLELETHVGLPPAVVVITHFDVLRGEGLEYIDKLKAAGVPVTKLHYADLLHGFVTMSVLPRAREAISDIARALQQAMES